MAPRNRRTDREGNRDHPASENRQPFENFHAGYLRIDEDHYYRSGIRGPKKYALYCLVAVMVILTFANLIATVSIIGALRISYQGLSAFEFVPSPDKLWRVFYDVDTYSMVFSKKGKLGGHLDQNLTLDAYDSSLHFISKNQERVKVSVEVNGTTVIADSFSVVDPNTSNTMFSSESIGADTLGQRQTNLTLDSLQVNKLSSRLDESLRIESDRSVYITGMEGFDMGGKSISIAASDGIIFTSTDGSIILSGTEGVFISETIATTEPLTVQSKTAKLCVCASTGKIVLSPPGTGCVLSGDQNPCSPT